MGWLGVIAGRQILSNIPQTALYWLAVGGILYTSGIIFLVWRKIPYNHTIWHIFVLGGSLSHVFAVYNLVPSI
jgi:hemolysin III